MSFVDAILAPLNDVQREVVTCCDGPMLVLAGAGSGKTRAVTHKIAYLLAQRRIMPYRVLAVTFTNKAAGEMRNRLRSLVGPAADGLEMGTFHSVCARLLRKHADLAGYKSSFTIYDDDDAQTVMRRVVKELGLDPKKFAPRPLLAAHEGLRNSLTDPGLWAAETGYRDGFRSHAVRVFERYDAVKRGYNGMDFSDLLHLMMRVLSEHAEVRTHYNERFEYVLVDEMQDTNHVQLELLRLFLGPHMRICAVGDDDQSIYGWRGARVENMLEFGRTFPGARILRMEQNYRSTRTILEAAHSVICRNRARHEKKLWTGNEEGEPVELFEADSEGDEARRVAERVQALVREGVPLRQMAVFFRTNAQSRSFEELFGKRKIAHVVVGGIRFYERAEVKDALAYLRLLHNPKDDVSFQRIINVPARGIGDVSLQKLGAVAGEHGCSLYEAGQLLLAATERERWANPIAEAVKLFERWRGLAAATGVDVLVKTVLEESGYMGRLEGLDAVEAESRIQNLDQLVGSIAEFEGSSEPGSLERYLEHVSLITDVDLWKTERDRVPLMTVHAAKGLEFDVVFATGMEDDLFPHENHSDGDELEEERRLFYVALTRARKRVFLSYARSRMRYGGHTYPPPSRFLAEMDQGRIRSQTVPPRRSFTQAVLVRRGVGLPGPGQAVADPPVQRAAPPVAAASGVGKAGQRVVHARHGSGVVLACVAQAAVPLCVVKFDTGVLVTVKADTLTLA